MILTAYRILHVVRSQYLRCCQIIAFIGSSYQCAHFGNWMRAMCARTLRTRAIRGLVADTDDSVDWPGLGERSGRYARALARVAAWHRAQAGWLGMSAGAGLSDVP